MTTEIMKNLILSTLTSYGEYALIILATVTSVAVAYLVYLFGKDKSFNVFGFYARNIPYKGYNRWRSKKWNLKNTM